ncbi:MAG: radical SAM protein [Myxococcota bacterium]|nr:radical SAM protein [Myxococcota bacterium]
MSTIPRAPVTCFWEITDACNLRCIHCEAEAGERSVDELGLPEALSLADDLAAAGCQQVMLTGGEPLVRADWPAIAACLAAKHIDVTVISNGLLVNEKVLARLIASGVTGVSISLDGTRAVHDEIRCPPRPSGRSSYDAAIQAITLLAASPLKTGVITQVHQRNIDDLTQMHETAVSLGADVWQVQLAMPLGRLLSLKYAYLIDPAQILSLVEQLSALIDKGGVAIAVGDNIGYYSKAEPKLRGSLRGKAGFWTGCKAGHRLVAICANGDVKGCPSHPRSFAVDNVRNTPFLEIWQNAKNFSYTTEWDEQLLEGGCRNCQFRRVCRAGCTTMAYAVTGTIYNNPFCVQQVTASYPGQ